MTTPTNSHKPWTDKGGHVKSAADHAIQTIQESQLKRQLLDRARRLFTRGKQTKDKEHRQAKEAELFQQIGRLQKEQEWFKKISTAQIPVNYASWLISNIRSSVSADNVPF